MKNFIIYLMLAFLMLPAVSQARDYLSEPSNDGFTGVLVTPTARVLSEDDYVIGFSQVYPYRNYYVGIGLYDRLEVLGRITEVIDFKMGEDEGEAEYWAGYGNFKDKFIAGKFLLHEETKYLPALAIGLNDPTGTKVYGAQYMVLSKEVYPFDFSIGMGLGRYGTKEFRTYSKKDVLKNFINPMEYKDHGNLFYSVQFRPTDKLALLYEFNPVDYETQQYDPAVRVNLVKKESDHNFGVRYHFSEYAYATLSYQRGNEVGVNLTLPFTLGEPLLPIYDPDVTVPHKFDNIDINAKAAYIVSQHGYAPIRVDVEDHTLYVMVENNKYYYIEDAVVKTMKTLSKTMGDKADSVVLIYARKGMPYMYVRANKMLMLDLEEGKISDEEFLQRVKMEYSIFDHDFENRDRFTKYFLGYKPQINFYFNDPSGFFKSAVGIRTWGGYNVTEKFAGILGFSYYPFNSISTENETFDRPVRSDGVEYTGNNINLDMALLHYTDRLDGIDTYYHSEGGILEIEYSGVNFDVAKSYRNSSLLLGAGGSLVYKRDPDNYLRLKDGGHSYHTAFLKSRIHAKKYGTYVDFTAGRFLAGDIGLRTEIVKDINGVKLSAWYTKTDTSIFNDVYNRGYEDIGITVSVPLRLFKGRESKSTYAQSMSAWTRDVGADVGKFTNLFDFIDTKYDKKR